MKTLGVLHSFGPITVSQRESGGWAVSWSIEWEFGEVGDAYDHVAKLIGLMRMTTKYRVAVRITPERTPGAKKPPRPEPVEGKEGVVI